MTVQPSADLLQRWTHDVRSRARDRGVVRFIGVVLPENQPMLDLANSLGFAASYDSNQHLMSISRELGDLPVGSPAVGGPG